MKLQFELTQSEYEELKSQQRDDETLGGTIRRLLVPKSVSKRKTDDMFRSSPELNSMFSEIFGSNFGKKG